MNLRPGRVSFKISVLIVLGGALGVSLGRIVARALIDKLMKVID